MRVVRGPVNVRLAIFSGYTQAMLDSSETSRAADRRAAHTFAPGYEDQVGAYLTNGVFLYRIVDVLVTEFEEITELEDCYGLDIVRVPTRALLARRLRVVTPT
jgi:hypothetical protein